MKTAVSPCSLPLGMFCAGESTKSLTFFIYSGFRPFERTIVLQKDSSGHVGFVFKNGKITQIAKDTSAARFVFVLCS